MGAMADSGFAPCEPPEQGYGGMAPVVLDFIASGHACAKKQYGYADMKALDKDAAAARNFVIKRHLPVQVAKRADVLFLIRKGEG